MNKLDKNIDICFRYISYSINIYKLRGVTEFLESCNQYVEIAREANAVSVSYYINFKGLCWIGELGAFSFACRRFTYIGKF